jgi:hypothetical protein
MTPENFCYWLRGFIEISTAGTFPEIHLDSDQINVIKDHLDLVMIKKTPTREAMLVKPDSGQATPLHAVKLPEHMFTGLTCSLPTQEIGFRSIYHDNNTRYCK